MGVFVLQVGYNQDDMTDQSTKILTTNDPEFYEYNLPIIDKQKIIKNFIDFKDFKIIKSIKHSPDKRFNLIELDGKRYIFVETDYFEIKYDTAEAKKLFKIKKLNWLKIINRNNNPEYLVITYEKTSNMVNYQLASID